MNIRMFLFNKFRLFKKVLKHKVRIPIIMFTNKVIDTLQPSLNFNMLIRVNITFSNNRPDHRVHSFFRKIRHLRSAFRNILRRVLHIIKVINRFRHLPMRQIRGKRNGLLGPHTPTHRKFHFLFDRALVMASPASRIIRVITTGVTLQCPLNISCAKEAQGRNFSSKVNNPATQ